MRMKRIWSGLSAILACLLCLAIIGNSTALSYASTINGFLGIQTSRIVEVEGDSVVPINFASAYGEVNGDNLKRLLEDSYAQAVTEGEEGMVLLRNENAALPLQEAERRVTLFGHAVVQPLYRASSAGSSAYKNGGAIDLYEALTEAGFTVNEAMYAAYQASPTVRMTDAAQWSLGEEKASFYTDELKASWMEDYNDVAIVMLAREGGEGLELYMETPTEGISQLALHQEEKDLLAMIRDSGKFDKTIVLLNSGNAMEVGWLEEYGVDACLWIGCPGQLGFRSLANILTGKVSPSGRLVDTYAVNSLSAPACVNNSYNNQTWTNLDEVLKTSTDIPGEASYYAVQAEGIYVGYKYYETRYEDAILGRYNAAGTAGSSTGKAWNYTDEVTYPFGYGLSYTTFEQTLDSVDVGSDDITVKVTVKNTGSAAGKEVVQIYAQTPYGEYEQQNKVEKSAIQLLDFGKTKLLQPGEKETLTIVCDKYLLASYDYTNVKGYYLSNGDYYITLGDNAHDALNNVLAAKGAAGMVNVLGQPAAGDAKKTHRWTERFNDTKYRNAEATGAVVTNLFDDCDINYWHDGAVTYLSRSDWEGTYPKAATQVACTPEMVKLLNGYLYEMAEDTPSAESFLQGEEDHGLVLAAMAGVDYDDEIWEDFLDQLTVGALAKQLPDMDGSVACPAVDKPAANLGDGPDGIGGLYDTYTAKKFGFEAKTTCYTGQTTLAATFSKELLQKRGEFLGEESIFLGLMELWAPGGNLHRTPFGGRNFEYYSEDATMNYLCSIPEVQAMEAKGVVSGIKHCAGNDQENNRIGIAVFFNEQAFRESGLRGFEGAIAVADARSAMQGFNRLGLVGCSASVAMNKGVLRGEWGLDGIIVTDATSSAETGYRANYIDQLVAGTDSWCIDPSAKSEAAIKKAINRNDDGYLLGELRRAAKNIFYCTVNSPAMNGYSANTRVEIITPWWQPLLEQIILGASILTGLSIIMLTVSTVIEWKRKKKGACRV